MLTRTASKNRRRPLMQHRTAQHRTAQWRLGAAVVEFAVVAPVMIMLTMGMIEVGRMVMVKQVMVNASREGARLAALASSTNAEVVASVEQKLQEASIAGVQVNVSPGDLAAATAGTPVQVTLSVPAQQVSWIPKPLFSLNKTITTSTTMRRESE